MDHLLLDLEIDAACWEFLAARIVARGGTKPAQPIVICLDAAPCEEHGYASIAICPECKSAPPDVFIRFDDQGEWDELTARAARMGLPPGQQTFTERMLARMEE